jgi:hypothetical protein
MASRIRTVDFLPEIFQTDANKQFLNSTLDQLTQQPKIKPIQGYIGRRIGVGVSNQDVYVPEPTTTRNNYQLEPGVAFLEPNTNTVNDVITYPGLIDTLGVENAITNRNDRLWNSEFYSYDPMVDYDKFINFGQYYWLPDGPNSVSVSAADIPLIKDFTVTRTQTGYSISDQLGNLPAITLIRGGNYTFTVDQPGNQFWIQSSQGKDGTLSYSSRSSRDVFGVSNNGQDDGTVTFFVPQRNAQDFFYEMPIDGSSDLVTNLRFDDIDDVTYDSFIAQFGGIDGISDLENKTLIFTTQVPGEEGGWVSPTSTEIPDSEKYGVWRITYIGDTNNPTLRLVSVRAVANQTKLLINFGTNGSLYYYKDAEGFWYLEPLLTANQNTLYYQDSTNNNFFGEIRLIDNTSEQTLYVDRDIVGATGYISPNGVTFTNGLKVKFDGLTVPSSYQGQTYYVEGVGTAIKLLPVANFLTPEQYVPDDSTTPDATDDGLNSPTQLDYLTINRASPDRNAWSRSNRWFHRDVIDQTASYNKTVATFDQDNRAKRPICEFRSGLRLFNFGTSGVDYVNIVDTRATDAFSDINGTIGYSYDGYSLQDGSRVIFANDSDPEVRNKIYAVTFVQFNDSSEPVIDLQPADLNEPDIPLDTTIVAISGTFFKGKSYWYNGSTWKLAQQKTGVNQAPLFDIYDANGVSYGDQDVYVSSEFTGTKIFGYKVGTGTADANLGFPLSYRTINNVGDIVFDNFLYTDTFTYVNNKVGTTQQVSVGTAREYSDRTTYSKQLGWQTSWTDNVTRQILSFEYNSLPLVLDVEVDQTLADIPVKVFVDGVFVLPTTYSYATNADGVTQITFNSNTAPVVGSLIEVSFLSNSVSTLGYYNVPLNLESNAININNSTTTLGTIRTHYSTICQNLQDFSGKIHGANNVRDLGNVVPYGEEIIQHSSPLTLAANFLYDKNFNFFDALNFASNSYEKFKTQLLDTVVKNDWGNKTASTILDECLVTINVGKNEMSPFYWTDAIPHGSVYNQTTYNITAIDDNIFDTLNIYNFTSANYKGILVYLNDVQLLGDGHDYTVATDGPRITVNTTLTVGDVLVIREYTNTYGSYIPQTPSSMGLYQAYEPEKYIDNTYTTPTNVIQGHDGSIIVAYDDIRDDVLLEFEKRVYNNIKVSDRYNTPIDVESVVPGQFRTTDYTQSEITDLLAESFLNWCGANKLPYRDQTYVADNEFTWNYSRSLSKIDNKLLLGGWRGIYFYFYDTDRPHTNPWEMLGFTERPTWWNNQYGSGPYTSGNLVLWQDLRDGKIADPANTRYDTRFARSGLLDCLPVDSEGNLVSPFTSCVGDYDSNSFRKSWVFGDQGPQETVWRRSSSYRFALQKLLALSQPAKYFNLLVDVDRYVYNTDFSQYLYDNRYRIEPQKLQVYGNGVIKNSYVNFIVDYNRTLGLDSTTNLTTKLANIDVRLCYRMASFSDKRYLKIFTEKSTPDSLNTSLLLPDESFQLFLYRNPTLAKANYSSVIVQATSGGYTVYGYSTSNPYFRIQKSIPNDNYFTASAGTKTVRLQKDFSDQVVLVPYGYTFTNENGVADFLNSYGEYLKRSGYEFNNVANGIIVNWAQMAEEFLYWSSQNWTEGSSINLNPGADLLSLEQDNRVVEPLGELGRFNQLINANKKPLTPKDYVVERLDNTFTLRGLNNNTFNYLDARLTAYEHIIVFDNASLFNDLIFDPGTGARQNRLFISGQTTYEWNGTLDAQGFILNQDNVKEWVPNKSYSKGQIVHYKDSYWSAGNLIPPKTKFDFNDWIKSDYEKITKGLLPNMATKGDLITNYYDVNTANLEQDADLLGFSLIGFRPRQYMTDLALNDISQVGLYSQFIGNKGTITNAEIFTKAVLDKEIAEYNITENWMVLQAEYGANANRSYYELELDQSLLLSNPNTLQVVEPLQQSIANQQILLSDVYKQSYKLTSTNILPTTTDTPPDAKLPSAGYVNWDDVDFKVFDLDELDATIQNINQIDLGSTIWIAKNNSYDWTVYRTGYVNAQLVTVRDNLDGTCTFSFNNTHGITRNQRIIIKFFNADVDGAYTVISTPSISTLIVQLSLPTNISSVTGTGICFELVSVRVNQPSDVSDLPFVNQLLTNSQIWADDDGTGNWAVYKKRYPFTPANPITASSPAISSEFGSSISQGLNNQGALIGAPKYEQEVGHTGTGAETTFSFTALNVSDADSVIVRVNDELQTLTVDYTVTLTPTVQEVVFTVAPGSGARVVIAVEGGAIYTFNKLSQVDYEQTSLLTVGTNNFLNLGNAVDCGSSQWSIVGANLSYEKQGYCAVINRSQQNGIYRITQIISPESYKLFKTIGYQDSSTLYDFGSVFTTTDEDSIGVTIDDLGTAAGVDWDLRGDRYIEFYDRPAVGSSIYIFQWEELGKDVTISNDERWMYLGAPGSNRVYAYQYTPVQTQIKEFTGDGETTTFKTSDVIIIDSDFASTQISVVRNDIQQLFSTDWTYDAANGSVVFTTAPNLLDRISIRRTQAISYFPSIASTNFSLDPLYTAVDITSFSVTLNGVLQRPNYDYMYIDDSSQNEIQFLRGGVTGTVIIRSEDHYKLVSALESSVTGRAGQSVATTTDGRQVIIGVPDYQLNGVEVGAVSTFDRGVEQFVVSNANTRTYTTYDAPIGQVQVKLNGEFLIPTTDFNNNGQFTVSGNTVTLDTDVTIAVGDVIEIENNVFREIQTFVSSNGTEGAKFGYSVDQCNTNCSVYVGAPFDSNAGLETGRAERWVNQSRLYGIIKSTRGAVLNPGDSIRINNTNVAVSAIPTWSASVAYSSGDFVQYTGIVYKAIADVTAGTALSTTTSWAVSNWPESFASDISDANIPNIAVSFANEIITLSLTNFAAGDEFLKLLVLPGRGSAFSSLRFNPYYNTQQISAPNPQVYGRFGNTVKIDSDADNLIIGAPDSAANRSMTLDSGDTYFDGKTTIWIDTLAKSGVVYTYDFLPAAGPSINNPGKFVYGTLLYDTGLAPFDQFGTAISYENGVLLIGSPGSDLGDSTGNFGRVSQINNANNQSVWYKVYQETPVVDVYSINGIFTYDKLDKQVTNYLDYIDPLQGKILGVAKQNIDYISGMDPASYNTGTVNNVGTTWGPRHIGEIWWDISTCRFINYHQDDLDYRSKRWGQLFPGSSVDVYQWTESNQPPANYTGQGTVYNTRSYVVNSVLDQGVFVTKYYFWVKGIEFVTAQKTLSTSAISQYIESPLSSGISYIAPLSSSALALYNCNSLLSGTDTILHVEFDRELNMDNVHSEWQLIKTEDPNSFVDAGLYRKMLDSFTGENTVGSAVPDPLLSVADRYGIAFRPRQSMFVNRFTALENYLTRANRILATLPIVELRPFDLLNSAAPEPTSASNQWDKKVATYTELTYQNLALVNPGYRYLVSSDETNSGLWTIYTVQTDKTLLLTRVQSYDTPRYWNYINWNKPGYNTSTQPVAEVATFSDLQLQSVSEGETVKVTANSAGVYEIYQWTKGEWDRVVLQNGTIAISAVLWDYALGNYGFDVEVFDSQRFDQNPITETRQILKAINNELFVDDLAIYRNELLILTFKYVESEQTVPEWLTKSSLIDVTHKIRDLIPYDIYKRDNQDFVINYINEVKPYHVQIKDFSLQYDGNDLYEGSLTDFDIPAYLDPITNTFISPQLNGPQYLHNGQLNTARRLVDDPIWQTWPYSQWFSNYTYTVSDVEIVNGGSGYTVAPQITVTGTATRQAELSARVNSAGQIIAVVVDDAGEGYTTTPIITVIGGNGSGAVLVAVVENNLIRNLNTTIKYDRYQYVTNVSDWQANTDYEVGQLVRYNNKVWEVIAGTDSTQYNSGNDFDETFYTVVPAADLSGVDRIMGYYVPDIVDPGREIAQLITGIDYPGVQVDGPDFNENTGFDVGPFDITPFDNIQYGPEGLPTYSNEILDAIYQSSFLDSYLGRRDTDINVEGGEFIDVYSSHAPEELVPGSNFDTLDLKVITRPGTDWQSNGHGFDFKQVSVSFALPATDIYFGDLISNPFAVRVVDTTSKRALNPIDDYTVSWWNQTVNVTNSVAGNEILVIAYSMGGGNQIFKDSYNGTAFVDDRLTIDLDYTDAAQFLVFRNSAITSNYTIVDPIEVTLDTPQASGVVVKVQYTSPNGTVVFSETTSTGSETVYGIPSDGSNIAINEEGTLVVFADGFTIIPADYTVTNLKPFYTTTVESTVTLSIFDYIQIVAFGSQSPQYSYSFPVREDFTYSGSALTLSNSLAYLNPINLVVEANGIRLRPYESIEWTGDGSSEAPFYLPTNGLIPQGTIADEDVIVYVDGVLQTLETDYRVSPWDGSSDRFVDFRENRIPAAGAEIIISVKTDAAYSLSGDQLTFNISIPNGTIISVYSWNDTREQDPITLVFKGPKQTGTQVSDPFDPLEELPSNNGLPGSFDYATLPDTQWSFDYGSGVIVESNDFDLVRTVTKPERLWVTLNGQYLENEVDYTVSGGVLSIGGATIGGSDVVAVNVFTDSVTPDGLEFRIFQDMLDNQKILRITNTTQLVQPLGLSDTTIYVEDASQLPNPSLEDNVFGAIIIDGERITYREKDAFTNTLTGLRRGVSGTGVDTHAVGARVDNVGQGEQLPSTYQITTYSDTFTANGDTNRFVAPNVVIDTGVDSTEMEEAVRVRVAGTELTEAEYFVSQTDPTEVTLINTPQDGVEVVVYIEKAKVMYAQGTETVYTYTADDINWTAVSTAILSYATSGLASSSPIGGFIGTIASDGYKYGDFNMDNSGPYGVTALDALLAAQYGAGSLADGATKTRIIDVFIPAFLTARTADPTNFNAYFNTPAPTTSGTASNGIPLQEQTTTAARFLRGEI